MASPKLAHIAPKGVEIMNSKMFVRMRWPTATLLLFGGLAVASWFAWTFVFNKEPAVIESVLPQGSVPAASSAVAALPKQQRQLAAPWPQQATDNRVLLARELAGATDYRVFALNALRRPDLGGISYAGYVIGLCRVYGTLRAASGLQDRNSIPYDAREESTLYAKRVGYMQAMEQRCASFSPEELSFDENLKLAGRGKQERDKHALIKEQYDAALQSGDESARLRAAAEVLAARDPLLLANMSQKIAIGRDSGRMGYTLDGVFYPVNSEEGGSLHVALDLLPCKFGLPCDSTDVNVVQACITHSQCFTNKEEFLTSELSPENRRRVADFLSRLTEIVNSGDANAFRRGG